MSRLLSLPGAVVVLQAASRAMGIDRSLLNPLLDHFPAPELQWNQAINSLPLRGNAVFLSPDSKWLYVTSSSGQLSKLDPANGQYLDIYDPEPLSDDGQGGQLPEDSDLKWGVFCGSGISFYDSPDGNQGGNSGGVWTGSYLVYSILDVPPPALAMPASSRVIAVRHQSNSNKLTIQWIRGISGSISGTPVIGSDGNMIYFTTNSLPIVTASPTTTPTNSPTITFSPTLSMQPSLASSSEPSLTQTPTEEPTISSNPTLTATPSISNEPTLTSLPTLTAMPSKAETEEPTSSPTTGPTTSPTTSPTASPAASITEAPTESPMVNIRKLQGFDDISGYFFVLSNLQNGNTIWTFNSREDFVIKKHLFAPVGIVHNPRRGNYNGGRNNGNDVIMWGSQPGTDPNQGETLLFQLPRDFNFTQLDKSKFQVRLLESVSWTTNMPPTFSQDGMEVYFAASGNRIVGWNRGQDFDIVANFGPVQLPPVDPNAGSFFQPIVLARDDTRLLLGNTALNGFFAVDYDTGGIVWELTNLGNRTIMTTPVVSADDSIVYFGKGDRLLSVDLSDGSLPWGAGYEHPENDGSSMTADFALATNGEYIYYCRSGSDISSVRVSAVIPTMDPVAAPSGMPSSVPSTSLIPTESSAPTESYLPTNSLGYEPPSDHPSEAPSIVPSVTLSLEPSLNPSEAATLPPTIIDIPGAELPEDNDDTGLGTSAIIGIAVGGGVGLILFLVALYFFCWKRRKGEDDGVDRDWRPPSTSEGGAGGTNEEDGFRYDDDDTGNNRWGQHTVADGPPQW